MTALVDHLEIAEFPLIAISAGALAGCVAAASLPNRVTGLGLLAPLGAFDSPGATDGMNSQIRLNFWLAAHAPWLLRPIVGALSRTARRGPARALRRVLATRPAEDRVILERPEVQAVLVENLAGQFANPPSVVAELRRAVAPWPVALGDITVPTQIWHGDRDDVHTPAMARHLERSIPGAKRDERAGVATFGSWTTPIRCSHPSLGGRLGTDVGSARAGFGRVLARPSDDRRRGTWCRDRAARRDTRLKWG